jgi:hypothetical protein
MVGPTEAKQRWDEPSCRRLSTKGVVEGFTKPAIMNLALKTLPKKGR